MPRALRPDRFVPENLSLKQVKELPLSQSGLTVRTVNALEEHGKFTVGDVLAMGREEVLRISNFGDKTLQTILDCFAALHRDLRPRPKEKPKCLASSTGRSASTARASRSITTTSRSRRVPAKSGKP